jgi:very-short-patch-repair endonuclease
MATKKSWITRKVKYGASGFKNPELRAQKISENTKKALSKPKIKQKIIADRKRRKEKFGYINSPETRKKLSNTWKRKWKNGEVTEKQKQNLIKCRENSKKTQFKKGHEVPEVWKEAVRESRAKQIFPIKDSTIEVKIQELLKQIGIEFFTHFYIKDIKNKYRCDIFIPSKKLVIECDGDYWHGNSDMFKDEQLSDRIINQKKLDEQRTNQLINKGYMIIRLWEHEIKKMNIEDLKLKLEINSNGM